MSCSDYYSARKELLEIISKDLLGPVKNDEIICDERPLDYYILGKLYPQQSDAGDVAVSSAEDCGEIEEEIGINLCNSRNPSSFGISFSLKSGISSFRIKTKAAKYILISADEARDKLGFSEGAYRESANFWQRVELDLEDCIINVSELTVGSIQSIILDDNLSIRILLHKVYSDSKTISVSMVNEAESAAGKYIDNCVNAFFQPQIQIEATEENSFDDIRRNIHISPDKELSELEMLYSHIGSYASGHGCAVNWEINNQGIPTKLYTEFLPHHEVLQMMPSPGFNSDILQMKKIAFSSKDDVIESLLELTKAYSDWINETEDKILQLDERYIEFANRNIYKCKTTLSTLNSSILSLKDDDVFKAFALANRAMFMQRKQLLINSHKYVSDELIKWYPFQLAFFLQEIISFAKPFEDPNDHRKKVDLLWFPTGGGKTEAYLGIAAFVIFLRRIRNGNSGAGVTVLMRYTMRLLSFQQFERASALICACDIIRQKEHLNGGEIGIGLWAGKALTPNKLEQAERILNGQIDENDESSNPVQITKCPWCGEEITKDNYICDHRRIRMSIKCPNPRCHFHNGLPVYLIDEEIYEHCPTFIVATIDKFAQVAFNYDTSSLFGKTKGFIPPELIIQDELHLISGPLGTITGLYEAAIQKLCENNGIKPKIIASTATIRNAKEQILALYDSDYTQFPPQGISIEDSFFAKISDRTEKPSRLYLGCMAIGTSPTTMMIRTLSSLLFASRYISTKEYDEKVIDSFWTLTAYFNTLRELGGAIIRVIDDIQDRFNYLCESKFKDIYPTKLSQNRYDKYKELTSREKSENIGEIIQRELKEQYTADGSTSPFDFLLTSNMISVGVDVGRLGTMVVVGQPKTTSEYIQATSRVGRETPGLVITTYNQAKTRDRSHYEDFTLYHNTFYRYVEATSVTPFSDRARDRALQALFVILCRNMIPQLSGNEDAINFDKTMPELKEIRDYIYNYVNEVDHDERDSVMQDLEDIEDEWEAKVSRNTKLRYQKRNRYDFKSEEILFEPDYCDDSRFRALNTMRSVETSVKVTTKEG